MRTASLQESEYTVRAEMVCVRPVVLLSAVLSTVGLPTLVSWQEVIPEVRHVSIVELPVRTSAGVAVRGVRMEPVETFSQELPSHV